MKRCPECRRDYHDDTLSFCLADGSLLVSGVPDEPATAIMSQVTDSPSGGKRPEPRTLANEAPTRPQIPVTKPDAEPHNNLEDVSSKRSVSANRLAKPLVGVGLAVLILFGLFFGYRYRAPSNAKQIESIAVMPFLNESDNADFEYLADGMTETLISKLSKVPNLHVKARGTIFRYKNIDTSPRTVGIELGVQAILNGRVAQRGDQLSMTVELIETATENVLWSEQYARKSSDLLALQSEIARDAVNQLHAKLTGAEEQNVVRNYTASPAAQDLYLRGRYHWNRRTVQEVTRSLEYFQRAVDTDPNYALAYVGLSDAHLMLGIIDAMAGSSAPADVLPPAIAAAERALVLEPNLADAYASRGHARWKDRDWAGAEADFKRSIEINPRYPSAHLFYALFLSFNGRAEESLVLSQRAVELDPYSVPIVSGQAMIYHLARRDDEALTIARRAVEIDPGFGLAYQRLGQIYLQKDMYSEAISALTRAVDLGSRGQLSLGTLACAYAESGNKDEARKLLAELSAVPNGHYVSSYILATVHLSLGDREAALDLLEKAYDERSIDMLSIKVDPKVDSLRGEPRFQGVVRKLGIP